MAAPVQNSSYNQAALAIRLQCGFTFAGLVVRHLKIADLDPLALGIAMQTLVKVLSITKDWIPKQQPADVVGIVVLGPLFCAAYTLASQAGTSVESICALALFTLNLEVIGPRNVWTELKKPSPVLHEGTEEVSLYQSSAKRMRTQIATSSLAIIATTMRIANMQPLAAGFAGSVLGTKEIRLLRKYPEPIQMIVTVAVCCASYALVSNLDIRVQALCYGTMLALNLAVIGPQNAWKELKA